MLSLHLSALLHADRQHLIFATAMLCTHDLARACSSNALALPHCIVRALNVAAIFYHDKPCVARVDTPPLPIAACSAMPCHRLTALGSSITHVSQSKPLQRCRFIPAAHHPCPLQPSGPINRGEQRISKPSPLVQYLVVKYLMPSLRLCPSDGETSLDLFKHRVELRANPEKPHLT